MKFNQSVVYAIKALKYISLQPTPPNAEGVALGTSIPYPFLSTILSRLRKVGILTTRKGPGAGYRLAKGLEEVTIGSIVEAVDKTTPEAMFDPVALNLRELSARALAQAVSTVV